MANLMSRLFTNRLFVTLCSALIILSGTYVAIRFAKGYRPTMNGDLRGTGLLAANSFPNGAQVYLNGKLTTATDTTMNLEPGSYDIEIKKDGYTPWKKTIKIEKELVTQTNALLFPTAPGLTPLTYTGATTITPSPDGQRLLYFVASASAQAKNGLYVMDLTDSVLSFQRGAHQIAQEIKGIDLQKAEYVWSPDSTQLLLSYDGKHLILDPNKLNNLNELTDVGYKLPRIFSEWEEEMYKRERVVLAKFPERMQQIATQSAINVYISPDDDRMMYTASTTIMLEDSILPQVQAANSQPQERELKAGGVYVYDRKEDRNFRIGTQQPENIPVVAPVAIKKTTVKKKVTPPIIEQVLVGKKSLAIDLYSNKPLSLTSSPSAFVSMQGKTLDETIKNFHAYYSSLHTHGIQWLPDSKHILLAKPDVVTVKEYDSTNEIVLYSGPFSEHFVYPWPNGSKLVMLTRLRQEQDSPLNLYAVTLK